MHPALISIMVGTLAAAVFLRLCGIALADDVKMRRESAEAARKAEQEKAAQAALENAEKTG